MLREFAEAGSLVDVVLMDIHMQLMDGVEAIRAIRRASPEQKILVVSSLRDDAWLRDALAAGANGFITKAADPADIRAAISTVARGGSAVEGRALGLLTEAYVERPAVGPSPTFTECFDQLTASEVRVWELLCEAKGNRDIASALHLAESTVKEHVTTILRKMGVKSRAEIIRQAALNDALRY